MAELTVHITKTLNTSVETAFDAWLNPDILAQFMTPMAGMPDSDVTNDPKPGGSFTIVMHVGDQDLPHTGRYLEIDRPNRLVFTWSSAHSVDDSEVTLEFSRVDGGKTEISLTHVKFINEAARSDHEGGWSNILAKLDAIVG